MKWIPVAKTKYVRRYIFVAVKLESEFIEIYNKTKNLSWTANSEVIAWEIIGLGTSVKVYKNVIVI